ncbi:MAG: putative PurR-regulated permease PerM [Planctomycetaceae bacterium]|jgi:predicted PurR-regulated permease PerM
MSQSSPRGRHLWQIAAVQDVFWIGLALAVVWFGFLIREVLNPILIGFGLAYVLNPGVRLAEQRFGIARSVTVSMIMLLTLGLLTTALIWMGPQLVEQIDTLIERAPKYGQRIETWLEGDRPLAKEARQLWMRFRDEASQSATKVFQHSGQALSLIGTALSTVLYLGAWAFLLPVYTFVFAWKFDSMIAACRDWLPESRRNRISDLTLQMDRAVGGFIRGRILIALMMSAMFAVGWWLVDVPYWLLLGVLTGLLTIVPYASALGWFVTLLVVLADGSSADRSLVDALLLSSVVFGVVQAFEGWILTPWIQGKELSMHPLTILTLVLVGGVVGGLYGMLLAIPAAACGKILFQEVLSERLQAWAEEAPHA